MKFYLIFTIVSTLIALSACAPTPAEMAEQSKALHRKLEQAATQQDSISIYREIAILESEARSRFQKDELKEYERLAH